MKKIICLFCVLVMLALPVAAAAAEVTVDPYATVTGMGKSIYQGYEPTIVGNTMTLYLPLRAEGFAGEITVSIALDDPHVFLLTSQPKDVTVTPTDGVYPVKLSLSLERNRRSGDYPATITLRGTDENGKEWTETMPYILRIRDGYTNHETMTPEISDVTSELNVGSEGSVSFTLTNPTTTQSIMDGVVTLTDSTGEILMTGSNRLTIPEILPGESATVTVPVTVKGNAAIAAHTLELKLSYSALGREGEWTEKMTLPVTQAIRLEQGGVQMDTAVAGELGNMTLPLMNMGKGELRNVLVKLEMDGVLDAQSVLVGTIEAGETRQARLSFTPKLDSVGQHTGTVTVSCEDVYGNTSTQTLDVILTVDEPIPEATSEEEAGEENVDVGKIVLIVLCILLAAGMAVEGKILTDKLHKIEEERL